MKKNSHQVELEAVGLPHPRLSSCPVACCSWRSSVVVARWAFHAHWVFSSPAQTTTKFAYINRRTVFFDHRIKLSRGHLQLEVRQWQPVFGWLTDFYGQMIFRERDTLSLQKTNPFSHSLCPS